MSENTEQWKAEGNCEKCRRNQHCNKRKPCTAHKRRIDRMTQSAMAKAFNTVYAKMFGGR